MSLDALDVPAVDVLPDSRARVTRNAVWRGNSWWVPIFCANCGTSGGFVPEENCTFACYLCQECSDKLGHIAHTYVEPDVMFWARVRQEQLEKYQRLLTPAEFATLSDDSSLAKLLKEHP